MIKQLGYILKVCCHPPSLLPLQGNQHLQLKVPLSNFLHVCTKMYIQTDTHIQKFCYYLFLLRWGHTLRMTAVCFSHLIHNNTSKARYTDLSQFFTHCIIFYRMISHNFKEMNIFTLKFQITLLKSLWQCILQQQCMSLPMSFQT